MENIFFEQGHKERFEKALLKTGHSKENSEFSSCLYILTSDIMHQYINDCFDFINNCIKPDALKKCWQTGSTYGLTCLAFNLFTENTPIPSDTSDEQREDVIIRYSVERVFWSLDMHNTNIAIMGIKIHEGLV